MTEPDVALTDFALALESAAFGTILWRGGRASGWLQFWFLLYFFAAGLASLCGGLVHGYFLEASSLGRAILWPTALLAIGVNALASWAIGASLLFSRMVGRRIMAAATMMVAIYSAVVLSGVETFRVAVVISLPATLFLLFSLVMVHRRDRRTGAMLAAAGVVTTLAAALVQQFGVGIHAVYFNHNASAHVVEAVALGLFFAGGQRLLDSASTNSQRSEACLHDASL